MYPTGVLGRSFYAGVGVGTPGPDLRPLPSVEADLARMHEVFVQRLGYVAADLGGPAGVRGSEPSAEELRTGLDDWLRRAQLGADDRLVIYFSGHGHRSARTGEHYLCLRGFDPASPSTGLQTASLATLALDRRHCPGRVWFILDCCFSGEAGLSIMTLAAQHAPEAVRSVWVTEASGRFHPAYAGAFSRAFVRSLPRAQTLGALDAIIRRELTDKAPQRVQSVAFEASGSSPLGGGWVAPSSAVSRERRRGRRLR